MNKEDDYVETGFNILYIAGGYMLGFIGGRVVAPFVSMLILLFTLAVVFFSLAIKENKKVKGGNNK